MRIRLDPMETFFFRDGRPFDRGEGWATGIFPPLPSTIYGAIRAAAISLSDCPLRKFDDGVSGVLCAEMGSKTSLGKFSIRSIVLHDGIGPHVPTPLDLRRRGQFPVLLGRNTTPEVVTDIDSDLYQPEQPDADNEWGASWIGHHALANYLKGSPGQIGKPRSQYFHIEPKTGIERGAEGTVKEGMLYNQEMIRLKDEYHLSVEAETVTTLGHCGALKLGHDGRLFSYQIVPNDTHFAFRDELKALFIDRLSGTDRRFKILFTSPALLKGGWLPGGVEDRKENGRQFHEWTIEPGLRLLVESAVLGRPMRVGGWDVANRKPKDMLRAVPPGSVYYCRLLEGNQARLFDLLFDRNLSDADPGKKQQGFGHMLPGLPRR